MTEPASTLLYPGKVYSAITKEKSFNLLQQMQGKFLQP